MTVQAKRTALSKNWEEVIHQLSEGERKAWLKKSLRGKLKVEINLGYQAKEYNFSISVF